MVTPIASSKPPSSASLSLGSPSRMRFWRWRSCSSTTISSSSVCLASAILVVMTPMNRFRIIMLAKTTKDAKYSTPMKGFG